MDTDISDILLSTICPFLTSLMVGRPWLFQPYGSYYLLTYNINFPVYTTVLYSLSSYCSVTILKYRRVDTPLSLILYKNEKEQVNRIELSSEDWKSPALTN